MGVIVDDLKILRREVINLFNFAFDLEFGEWAWLSLNLWVQDMLETYFFTL